MRRENGNGKVFSCAARVHAPVFRLAFGMLVCAYPRICLTSPAPSSDAQPTPRVVPAQHRACVPLPLVFQPQPAAAFPRSESHLSTSAPGALALALPARARAGALTFHVRAGGCPTFAFARGAWPLSGEMFRSGVHVSFLGVLGCVTLCTAAPTGCSCAQAHHTVTTFFLLHNTGR